MSVESDLRDALLDSAPLLAVVPANRIRIDAVPAGFQRPYIVLSKQSSTAELGSDNTLLGAVTTIDIQCIGTNRSNAIAVGALVRTAMRTYGAPSDRGGAGFDPENDLEVEVVTVDWLEG